MLYRILTEDKNRADVRDIVNFHYKGFTLYRTTGYWNGTKENSLVIEILLPEQEDEKINKVAQKIKERNEQKAVLIQKINEQSVFV